MKVIESVVPTPNNKLASARQPIPGNFRKGMQYLVMDIYLTGKRGREKSGDPIKAL
jgi:hypothetical protein